MLDVVIMSGHTKEHTMETLKALFTGWVADDPHPTYSRLDLLDGLNPVVSGGCYHKNHRRCDTTACQCGCHR